MKIALATLLDHIERVTYRSLCGHDPSGTYYELWVCPDGSIQRHMQIGYSYPAWMNHAEDYPRPIPSRVFCIRQDVSGYDPDCGILEIGDCDEDEAEFWLDEAREDLVTDRETVADLRDAGCRLSPMHHTGRIEDWDQVMTPEQMAQMVADLGEDGYEVDTSGYDLPTVPTEAI